ncbi:MAG: sugar phosphate isomerase/epimerase family protein [Rhodothermus sp.]|nr:sugar phosphate isomerase/epimerase family protein [Rhodothermus sp.]
MNRRDFLERASALLAVGLGWTPAGMADRRPWFRISLAQWSLHRTIFGGKLDALDFPVVARREFGIEAVEYVNQFFFDRARDRAYLGELKRRAEGEGVRSLLIMCDREGRLGDPDPGRRRQAVENHYKWVEAARFLGCHSIRVNAASEGTYEEQQKLAADGLRRLVEFSAEHELNVLVENHGGLSSNGAWLAGVIRLVDHPRCGTLPDFGNWRVDEKSQYDPYQGLAELMPFAKGVSAKSYDFDAEGNETRLDYVRLLRIVRDAGYQGYIGIEYEGNRLEEPAGIRATKALLERVRTLLAEEHQEDQGGPR